MSVKANDGDFATLGPDVVDMEGIELIDLENGEILIYSRDNEDEWIQSDDHIDLEYMI